MKKSIVRVGMLSVLALSSMGLTACTDEQIALGAGLVIGAAVAGAGDDGGHDHGDYHRPPPHHGGHGGGWDRGGRRGGRWSQEVTAVAPALLVSNDVLSAANHFQISPVAADQVLAALVAAQNKDFAKLSEIGLQREDILAIGRGENPSASALVGLSEKLGLEMGEAHGVIQQMKVDIETATN